MFLNSLVPTRPPSPILRSNLFSRKDTTPWPHAEPEGYVLTANGDISLTKKNFLPTVPSDITAGAHRSRSPQPGIKKTALERREVSEPRRLLEGNISDDGWLFLAVPAPEPYPEHQAAFRVDGSHIAWTRIRIQDDRRRAARGEPKAAEARGAERNWTGALPDHAAYRSAARGA